MAASQSPTVRLRRLAAELRRLREQDGRTADQAAKALGWSKPKLLRLENRLATKPQAAMVCELLDLYGVSGDRRDAILTLVREARQRGWWQPYTGALTSGHATYIGLEDEADVVRTYEGTVVPGLLQTEDYARATIQGVAPGLAADVVESRVEIRLHRQRLYRQRLLLAADDEQPNAGQPLKRLWAIFDEAVLHRVVGGPQVMRGQLQHLLAAAAHPSVVLQVIPFSAGAHPGIPGSFVHLTFAQPLDPEVVYVDSPAGQALIEEDAEVAVFRGTFEQLKGAALPQDKTVDMIEKQLKAMLDTDH
jgi:transcriptional regulator with XRE-family HTH domain